MSLENIFYGYGTIIKELGFLIKTLPEEKVENVLQCIYITKKVFVDWQKEHDKEINLSPYTVLEGTTVQKVNMDKVISHLYKLFIMIGRITKAKKIAHEKIKKDLVSYGYIIIYKE